MTEKIPWLSITEGNVKIAECDVPYLSPLFKVGSVIQKKAANTNKDKKDNACLVLIAYFCKRIMNL